MNNHVAHSNIHALDTQLHSSLDPSPSKSNKPSFRRAALIFVFCACSAGALLLLCADGVIDLFVYVLHDKE